MSAVLLGTSRDNRELGYSFFVKRLSLNLAWDLLSFGFWLKPRKFKMLHLLSSYWKTDQVTQYWRNFWVPLTKQCKSHHPERYSTDQHEQGHLLNYIWSFLKLRLNSSQAINLSNSVFYYVGYSKMRVNSEIWDTNDSTQLSKDPSILLWIILWSIHHLS